AADRSPDGDDAALDLGVHLARFPDDERVLGDDAFLELAVDTEGVAETQLPVELGSRIHESVEVFGRQALDLDHRRTPRGHGARLDDITRALTTAAGGRGGRGARRAGCARPPSRRRSGAGHRAPGVRS